MGPMDLGIQLWHTHTHTPTHKHGFALVTIRFTHSSPDRDPNDKVAASHRVNPLAHEHPCARKHIRDSPSDST